ncbi:MAG: 2,3-bisphosphoglycerate-independent phosphoglycerate mutase [Xanthomonadales bacterium]|nr:2,3-bisphosphoglycerate-independent phosphoglycerate mutase [Xanthomonadales bacterium]
MNTALPTPKPVLLLILDGWGHREPAPDNAISQANAPNWRKLLADCSNTLIHTSGRAVGLPDGQMGNSEVGHMNLGAGRVVYQDLTRIDVAIEDGSFFNNSELCAAADAAKANDGTLQIIGLLSPGGVHSHENHIFALIDLAAKRGVSQIAVHALLDGRDTPPKSAKASLERLQAKLDATPGARLASIGGRYFGMDRDQRWDRVERAWEAIVNADGERADSGIAGLEAAYARGETDEFVAPTAIGDGAALKDGDAIIFANFRADRARQLSRAFVEPGFDGFIAKRRPALSCFVCMSEYAADIPAPVAFAKEDLRNTLAEVLAANGKTQLRIAETEKYAHVTFFFSGGREAEWPGEVRELVPSPKVATYDLQPEMSCPEVTNHLVDAISQQRFDVIVCNLANPDMVGHTGKLDAAIKAVEAIDVALGRIRAALESVGGAMLLTADHGNLEQMNDADSGQPHTAHTTGPVPLVYLGPRPAKLAGDGALKDIAPTLLELIDIAAPAEMGGHSLLLPA